MKAVLISEVALKHPTLNEDVIEKIVSFQFADANKATRIHKEVEISGFGKFLISPSKLNRRLKKLQIMRESMSKNTKFSEERLEDIDAKINYLKEKQNEFQCKGDIGGSEE